MPLLDVAPRSFDEYVADGRRTRPGRRARGVPRSGHRGSREERTPGPRRRRVPTGEKWRSIRATGTGARFAVCNGAEGEPATFKDRTLLRTNPYQVLEGLAIAAYAVGAERAYIGVKEIVRPRRCRP